MSNMCTILRNLVYLSTNVCHRPTRVPVKNVQQTYHLLRLVAGRRYCSSGGGGGPAKGPEKPALQDLKRKQYTWKQPITWRALGIFSVVTAGMLAFLFHLKGKKDAIREKERRRTLGKAKIGGKFELIGYEGKPITNEDFLGQWLLVYFGFTHCPDVCPDELEKIAEVVNKIDGNTNVANIQPVFITVDPARDNLAAIKGYLAEFHPKFIGLTGSVEQIAAVCKAYRVYFSQGPKDEDDDYIVDHTIISYLVDPSGDFVDYYGQNTDAKHLCDNIALKMAMYDSSH